MSDLPPFDSRERERRGLLLRMGCAALIAAALGGYFLAYFQYVKRAETEVTINGVMFKRGEPDYGEDPIYDGLRAAVFTPAHAIDRKLRRVYWADRKYEPWD